MCQSNKNDVYCEKEVEILEVGTFQSADQGSLLCASQSKVCGEGSREDRGKDKEMDLVRRKQQEDKGGRFLRRMSRYERLVKEMKMPFTAQDIIEKSLDQFYDLLARIDLSGENINLCRDIRRRGRNKVS